MIPPRSTHSKHAIKKYSFPTKITKLYSLHKFQHIFPMQISPNRDDSSNSSSGIQLQRFSQPEQRHPPVQQSRNVQPYQNIPLSNSFDQSLLEYPSIRFQDIRNKEQCIFDSIVVDSALSDQLIKVQRQNQLLELEIQQMESRKEELQGYYEKLKRKSKVSMNCNEELRQIYSQADWANSTNVREQLKQYQLTEEEVNVKNESLSIVKQKLKEMYRKLKNQEDEKIEKILYFSDVNLEMERKVKEIKKRAAMESRMIREQLRGQKKREEIECIGKLRKSIKELESIVGNNP